MKRLTDNISNGWELLLLCLLILVLAILSLVDPKPLNEN